MDSSTFFIIGANGQLGTALRLKYPEAKFADISELDITDQDSVHGFDWSRITHIFNAAAYTNVDGAETIEGRVASWKVNAHAPGYLSAIASEHDIILIHISTDYVFDGVTSPHFESESFSPLSAYGASKAAGDLVVSSAPKHYILRTSWLIGDGANFVRTMLCVGQKGLSPTVVSDQIGRLTFTSELVSAIDHLLNSKAPWGTYNVTNDGPATSWADITRAIYRYAELDVGVTDASTEEYFKGKANIAPRPLQSMLALDKLHETGFQSADWEADLAEYVKMEIAK